MMRTKDWFYGACSALVMWSAFVACEASSGERRVEIESFLVGTGGFEPFENVPPTGTDPWTVTLDEAWAALGPIYLFEGEPLLGRLFETLVIPRAMAHPGHYQEGEALGEALDQTVVDLLDPEPLRLGIMNAVTGECHSAQVGIGTAEPGIDEIEQLEGHALLLRGVARREEEQIPFEAWLDVDLFVEGIAFEHDIDESPGHLLVEVDLTRWLRRVDFATATLGDSADEVATFKDGSQAHNALTRGVDNTLAYHPRWVEE